MRTLPSAVLATTIALGSAWVALMPKEHANVGVAFLTPNMSPPLSWSGAPPNGLTGEQLRAAIDGHVVATSQLTGIYKRSRWK